MEVQVLGSAPMITQWYKDCRELNNDDKYLLGREPNGVYKCHVGNPVRRDSGTYMLKVENPYGSEYMKHEVNFFTKNDYLHVHGISHADPKEKRKHMDTVKLVKREETPKPEEEKREIAHKVRPEILALEPPEPKPVQEEEVKVKKPKKVPEPLEFITKLRNQTVVKGTNIKLSCCVSEVNRIEAAWFKNDEPLELDSRVKATLNKESANAVLEIKNATVDDAGTYKCALKTSTDSIEGTCVVNVFEEQSVDPTDVPPTFIVPIKGEFNLKIKTDTNK